MQGVITMAMIGKVRRMHFRENKTVREIARATSLSRNTVRKYLRVEQVDEPRYRRAVASTKLTPFHETVMQALKADARRPKRERRTARALHEELKAAGYDGGYSRLTDFIRAWREGVGQALNTTAFVPLAFELGEAFQFDWSEEGLVIGGVYRRVQLAHMKLCAVRRPLGNSLQRLGDDGVHMLVLDRAWRTGARRIEQPVQPVLDEPGAPLRDGLRGHPLPARDALVVDAVGARQNNACPQRQRLSGLAPQRQRHELLTFGFGQHQLRFRPSSHRHPRRVHTVHDRSALLGLVQRISNSRHYGSVTPASRRPRCTPALTRPSGSKRSKPPRHRACDQVDFAQPTS